MIEIQPIELGLPAKPATNIVINVISFCTQDTTCGLSYVIQSAENEALAYGNFILTEEQFSEWGFDNLYLENLVLDYLELIRI